MRQHGIGTAIILWTATLCWFPAGMLAASNDSTAPELKAVRIQANAPGIDGDLTDPIWQQPGIELARDFLQRQQDEGEPATESTLVAVAYDDHAIYFAFWAYDSEPDKVIGRLVRRDRFAESDHVTVRLDPFHDHQTGYWFQLSVAGVQRDFRIYNDDVFDDTWDAVWEGGVQRQPWGWSAEFRIPFHCLRFGERDEHTWGMNVTRYISRKSESVWWTFAPASQKGFASLFGHLTGLRGIEPARHLEVLPYAVTQVDTEPKSLGNTDGRDLLGNLGLDIKYGLTSNLTLDATINPDFGQVELDRPVLNLSAFETYYSEKRPFFIEGADLFDTEYTLFYSRRIGRSPGGVEDGELLDYSSLPKATSILGAAKLTGKLSGGTSIAFMNAVTAKESAEYLALDTLAADTVSRTKTLEPRANYTVLRVKQDMFHGSTIGATATLATQETEYPATTGGIDWRLFTPSGTWLFAGQAVFSRVHGEEFGKGISAEIMKYAGEHIRGNIAFGYEDDHLDLNRLGFLSRNGRRRGSCWVQYRTDDDWWIIRNTWTNLNYYAAWNHDGFNITHGWNFNSQFEFLNNWWLNGGFNQDWDRYDDYETRGRGLWEEPHAWGWWASFGTDRRKPVFLNLNPGSGANRNGTWWAHYTGVTVQPRSDMEFEVGVNYLRHFGRTYWAGNFGEDSTVFADMDKDEVQLSFSASLVLSPTLSWQISGQGVIAALDYSNYRAYLGGTDYGGSVDTTYFVQYYPDEYLRRDRNYSDFNMTMIMRWEYLPGSTLYLVWTRARGENDYNRHDLDFSRDLDRFFSAGSRNTFLIKTSYWMNI
ncbi:MAG: carbohydrate binding family 9 domain-containing protein [Candidatus Zixiibacteriota bacterium]|nr:MAG: carbohydrate binding family 9 domain-containing protein [candidate division Zixibacteria bacterium]